LSTVLPTAARRRIGPSASAGTGCASHLWGTGRVSGALELRLLRRERSATNSLELQEGLGVRRKSSRWRVERECPFTDADGDTGRKVARAVGVLNAVVLNDLLRTLDGGTRYGVSGGFLGGVGVSTWSGRE